MEAPATPWPRASAAWWMVALLFLAGICSVIDRSVLNMVVDPVRHDLGISDSQIGMLQGLAFGMFYAFMGLPMGLAADRVSRRNLLMGGIALWSISTIGSGLAGSFGHLFAARLLVGLGEAALGPCAISLIADLFPPHKRGRPISIYMTGQSLAQGLGIILTGLVLAHAARGGFAGWPLLGGLVPWRVIFVISGGLGLIIVLAMLTAREPSRRGSLKADAAPSIKESAVWFWAHKAVLAPLYLGFAVCFTAAYGGAAWQPTMLMRGFGMTPQFVGAWLGPLSMAFSVAGPLVGGWLVDRSMKAGRPLLRFTLLAALPLLALPSTLAVFAPGPHLAVVLVATGNAIYAACGTLLFATLQSLVPARMRGMSIALTLVMNTLLGAACGPLLVASVTHGLLGDPARVGWGIAFVAGPSVLAAAGLFALARRTIMRSSEDFLQSS
ncbi:MFS transporter [Novosphingobium sp.]|uniref:MFS transporter n=1 Tax=Novosphingobium sp. TaxID=1874826 RepID=UPI0031DAFD1B